MFNGLLDNLSVGIGSVARERRKRFVSTWSNIYWLEPLAKGAILMAYPNDWLLFSSSPDGYRFERDFKQKPEVDTILTYMSI